MKKQLRALPCSDPVRCKLAQVLDSLGFAEKQVLKTIGQIRRLCQQDPELSQCIQYVRTIPGIGWMVASQLLARSGDWRELQKVRQLAAFVGVVPTERSTGERTERGAIPHSGDGRLRSKLIQAAGAAIRQDAELREFYRSVCRTHPRDRAPRIALVAVARKLTTRSAAVLMEQRPYILRPPLASAPLTPEETGPQGTTRRQAEPGETSS